MVKYKQLDTLAKDVYRVVNLDSTYDYPHELGDAKRKARIGDTVTLIANYGYTVKGADDWYEVLSTKTGFIYLVHVSELTDEIGYTDVIINWIESR